MERRRADSNSYWYLHGNCNNSERLYRDKFHCDNPRCELTNGEHYRSDNGINLYRQQHRADGDRHKQRHGNMERRRADSNSYWYLHSNRNNCKRLYRDEFHHHNPRCDLTNGEHQRTDDGTNL